MGLKHSKAGQVTKMVEEPESEEESETLEIFQVENPSEEFDEETQRTWYHRCEKNASYHNGYIPINDLNLYHLPDTIRLESMLHYIRLRAQLVVKITVRNISIARPDNDKSAEFRGKWIPLSATGYAWICSENQTVTECPKKSCDLNSKETCENNHFVYRGILITTNQHVIFNNEEAKETEVEFFFDDKKEEKFVVKGFGYSLREDSDKKDYVSLKIYCHDESLFQRICHLNEEIMKTWENIPDDYKLEFEKHAIAISHPHGHSKVVSIGNLLGREMLEENGCRVTKYTCVTCCGSSGAPILTGAYWTNPFVHSSCRSVHNKKSDTRSFTGVSYSY